MFRLPARSIQKSAGKSSVVGSRSLIIFSRKNGRCTDGSVRADPTMFIDSSLEPLRERVPEGSWKQWRFYGHPHDRRLRYPICPSDTETEGMLKMDIRIPGNHQSTESPSPGLVGTCVHVSDDSALPSALSLSARHDLRSSRWSPSLLVP